MFFANHMRTCITDSYVGATYTNSYHLHLVTIYKLPYVLVIIQICMITSYELTFIRFLAVQIQNYELVHHLTIRNHSSPPAAPAAATTVHNAGATTVATGRYITRRSQRIAEENEVGRRSRYVLLNLYNFSLQFVGC